MDPTARIANLNWPALVDSLNERGYATIAGLMERRECADLIATYTDETRFRKRVDMARLRFGLGEYKYFAAPLPPLIARMREALYRQLSPVANEWNRAMRRPMRFPPELHAFLDQCRDRGQNRPTPLILRYETGGYNCLHQDIYGQIAFPLQFTCVLSQRGVDFEGGEFLLVEQRPRAQSRAEAITLGFGDAIVFSNAHRPVKGARGYYRVNVRHGVSPLRWGLRYSLGIIFHDAK